MRMAAPGGKIGYAALKLGGSLIMLADVFPDRADPGREDLGDPPAMVMVYVEDVDAVVSRALKAGATVERAVGNQFYGDRAGQVRDPFGQRLFVATHVKDVAPEEMEKRAAAAMSG